MFEKKNGKRFLASVMALVMLLSLAPVGALAAGETTEESPAVALPANEDNPKPVVTDEGNTANTNEEPTSPPPNKGDTIILTDNNNTSTAISEAEIIPEEKMFDEAFSVNPDTSNSNNIAECWGDWGGNKDNREPVTTDSTTKYVIRFYVSNTGTKNSYTEKNKYTIANQPDSNKEEDTLELSVSPGYAILTGYNDVATGIDWQNFTRVNITGDAQVKAWLNQYASKRVPEGLTNSNNVEEIVNQVNTQYQGNNKGYNLPQLKENYFTGFKFVEAKYVGSGESSIHVHVELIRNLEYVTRTVHYKANNGTENEGSDSKIYEKTATATATVKENMFTWAGYKFTGWNTQANGNGTSYSPNSSIQFGDNTDVTLYAQWEAKKYKVSYDLNYVGATEECATKENVLWGNDKLLPTTDPTRTGYKFTGWYTATENGKKVEGTTKYSEIAENDGVEQVTLYAYWTANTHKVTYTDGANGTVFSNVEKAGTYGEAIPKYNNDNTSPTRDGYTFKGWTSSVSGITPSSVMPDQEVTFTATWQQQNPSSATVNYTINKHFKDNKGNTIKDDNGTSTPGAKNATLGSLITNDAVNQTDGDNKYVYVPGETTFKMDGNTVTSNTQLTSEATIDLYYYLDKVGETSEKNPNGGPDNIPDAWQYKVTFKVVNGSWDNKTNEAIVKYVTKKDAAGKDSATGTATLADVPAVGNEPNSGYRASGKWDTTPATGLEIKKDTVFTYNYDQKSGGSGGSGGSSRPSTPPTVDIPDDVPTGLNGKDHYAYIIGYGNNDVRPQNNITRAEVATIFFRLLTDETRTANMTKSNGYNDVKDGDWFCCAVSTLSKMGIIKGYEDGSFKPNDPISRAEFAAIAARFDPDGDKTPATFADVTSHWAKDEISIAANHGWIKGYEDGSFKPDQKITRAETMTLVNRVLNRLPETKDDLHKDMKTWVDNMDETAWYYLAVQEATNSHYFKNKTSTKFEQWTDLRDTRDWSELEK